MAQRHCWGTPSGGDLRERDILPKMAKPTTESTRPLTRLDVCYSTDALFFFCFYFEIGCLRSSTHLTKTMILTKLKTQANEQTEGPR